MTLRYKKTEPPDFEQPQYMYITKHDPRAFKSFLQFTITAKLSFLQNTFLFIYYGT